jgi:AbrB family looped-hinge helix DNA binding protein
VVIPKDIRDRLGIQPGDEVLVTDYDGVVRIRKPYKDPIEAGWGLLKGMGTVADYLREKREEAEREERHLPRPLDSLD